MGSASWLTHLLSSLESFVTHLEALPDFLWNVEHLSVRLIAVIIRILIVSMGILSAAKLLYRMVRAAMRPP